MHSLSRQDLFSLEQYSVERKAFRAKVLQHKKHRQVHLGKHVSLYFEDRLTIQYQIQEMLRIEKIFEADAIQDELDAYNPLIPSGSNWKATCMIEYTDVEQRKEALQKLVGIENTIWIQVHDHEPVYAIANEDLERSNEEKTSAVHFLRFEFDKDCVSSLKAGAKVSMGVNHDNYQFNLEPLPEAVRQSLVTDLD